MAISIDFSILHSSPNTTLQLLSRNAYRHANIHDPMRFYFWPLIGKMYRNRVEYCLDNCSGGKTILEIGFGAGATFFNLAKMYDSIFGIDFDSDISAINKIYKKMRKNLHLCNGKAEQLPYGSEKFDTVLLISILEHLSPRNLAQAFKEIYRVLKPGGQLVYGVPVEREMMIFAFRLLGCNIREHHFSTEEDISKSASKIFGYGKINKMLGYPGMIGSVYEIGTFTKKE